MQTRESRITWSSISSWMMHLNRRPKRQHGVLLQSFKQECSSNQQHKSPHNQLGHHMTLLSVYRALRSHQCRYQQRVPVWGFDMFLTSAFPECLFLGGVMSLWVQQILTPKDAQDFLLGHLQPLNSLGPKEISFVSQILSFLKTPRPQIQNIPHMWMIHSEELFLFLTAAVWFHLQIFSLKLLLIPELHR